MLSRFVEAVQKNCDIADARHAREATLCTYLLQMREHYCWERGLALAAQPPKEDLARWMTEREARWNELESEAYAALPVGTRDHDPFHAREIGRALEPEGLLYGAGYGRFQRPHFFLAALERSEWREGIRVLVAGREFARDLAAPLAALQDDTIYVRREAVRRWLWEKVELWQTRGTQGAHGYWQARDPHAFDRLVEAETETVILHELGEARAASLLGPSWENMLGGLTDRRAELLARAVRDNLADCLITLPALLERDAHASIHFYFSQFDGMRRELFPALAAAYREWSERGAPNALRGAIGAGAAHWERIARRLLAASPGPDPDAFVL